MSINFKIPCFYLGLWLAIVWQPSISMGQETNTGYDPGLTKRCLKSPHSGSPNYFTDTAGCTMSGNRTLLNTARSYSSGAVCTGVADQSTPVNTLSGNISINWASLSGNSLRLDLINDMYNKVSPCSGRVLYWSGIVDDARYGGGPLPRPSQAVYYGSYVYNTTGTSGMSRMGAVFEGSWDGKTHTVEINFYQSANWPDSHMAADIVKHTVRADGSVYIQLNGAQLAPAYRLFLNQVTDVKVSWHVVLDNLIKRNLLPVPVHSLDFAKTLRVGSFTEVDNNNNQRSLRSMLYMNSLKVVKYSIPEMPINPDILRSFLLNVIDD